ncbi:hypothetical protein ACFOLF_21950 [Paenibacillus sepulcri]|uniref:Uncharacterized protein n=1 Tax=Paenibacillus sepulcri TaxID=359917 RepID=A0ABS7C0H0_9BACL|nr:hypothetical protein [Paenibacillus sepulcri]
MRNLRKTIKKSGIALAAVAMLSMPAAASAAADSSSALRGGGVGPILTIPHVPINIQFHLGDVRLLVSPETRNLPVNFQQNITSITVIPTIGSAGDFKAEIINNGTQIRFTKNTFARYASAKIVLTTSNNLTGYYNITEETLY